MASPLKYNPVALSLGDKPSFVGNTDGDTPTIQLPIRMLGMDSPELHYGGATEDNPGRLDAAFAGFLAAKGSKLDAGLREHLAPRLDAGACTRHIRAGQAAHAHFAQIVEQRLRGKLFKNGRYGAPRRLHTMVAPEIFDHYGRLLAYVAPAYTAAERKTPGASRRVTFNLQMMQDGHATSLIIYPNLPKPSDLALVSSAMRDARSAGLGLWQPGPPLLHAFEFRWIADMAAGRGRGPSRFCGDWRSGKLYTPQHYWRVAPEDRIWFYPRDVGAAVAIGFTLQV